MAKKPDPLLTRIGQYTGNLVLRALIWLALLLPYETRVRWMGGLVARVLGPLSRFDKRVRDNLNLVCPELPKAEVDRLSRAVLDNAGRTVMEFYSGAEFIERAKQAKIGGPGFATLEAAQANRQPVIFVTAHFGNYDVVRAHLIARGFTIGGLYRKMSNPYFNTQYVRNLKSIGTPVFEQGRRGTMEMVRYLRDGGTLGILTDVHVHGGADLMFFGHPAVTSTVTAELALKYKAILIPIYAIRQPDGFDFEITVQEPITHSDPETMTQDVNDGLEALVRQHMDQWFWIHRRWKPYIVPDQTDV